MYVDTLDDIYLTPATIVNTSDIPLPY